METICWPGLGPCSSRWCSSAGPHHYPVAAAPLALGLGGLLLAVFTRRELALARQWCEPLFDMALFRYASFRWGGLVGLLRYLAQFAVNYSVTLFLQMFEGFKALQAGLVSMPAASACSGRCWWGCSCKGRASSGFGAWSHRP